MTNSSPETAPKKGETADQYKARIAETQRELERQKAFKPQPVPAGTPEPTAAVAPAAQVNAPGPVAEPPSPPAAPAITGNKEVDEWWAKKNFKSTEDMANSYRELERELSRKNMELARSQPPPAPPPPVAPMPNYWQQQTPPAYVPPNPNPWANPYAPPMPVPPNAPLPTQAKEELAKQYGLAPEDFEKVYAVANDLSQTTVRRELERVMPGIVNQVRAVNQAVMRQNEMVDLMAEPTWKNPQVQFEMHKVLQEDPAILQRQTLPYRYAHDEALKRIARANLGGSPTNPTFLTNGVASSAPRPPAMAGSNGKGQEAAPAGSASVEITPEQFAGLSMKEKTEFLRASGVLGR